MNHATMALTAGTLLLLMASAIHVDDPNAYQGPGQDQGLAEVLGDRTVHLVHGRIPTLAPDDGFLSVAPETPYTSDEARALRTFLESGGRVLLVGADAPTRGLLSMLDTGLAIGAPIVSPVAVDGQPLVYATETFDLPAQVPSPGSAVVTGGTDRLLVTSRLAWADTQTNGRPDLGETQGPFAVAARAPVGAGAIVVLTDPSLLRLADVARPLLDWLQPDGRIIVDESHRGADPFGMAPILAGQRPALLAALWTIAAVAAIAWSVGLRIRRRGRRRPRIPDDAFTRRLLEELP